MSADFKSHLKRHHFERQSYLTKMDNEFQKHAEKLPVSLDFLELAKEFVEIPHIQEISKTLLTPARSSRIDPVGTVEFFEQLFNQLKNLLPDIPENVFEEILGSLKIVHEQVQDSLITPAGNIKSALESLKPDESYILALPHQTRSGLSLENLARYQKNHDETFDITLFHAAPGTSDSQGGLISSVSEKSYPALYYSKVPIKEIFGMRDLAENSGAHIEALHKAMSEPAEDSNALSGAFKPLSAYQTLPKNPFARLTHVGHAHSLKGVHAFLYDCISQKIPVTAQKTEVKHHYKAIIAMSRFMLTMVSYHEIERISKLEKDGKLDTSVFYSQVGLIEEALQSTARYFMKEKQNPHLIKYHAEVAGTINEMKLTIEKTSHASQFSNEPDWSPLQLRDQVKRGKAFVEHYLDQLKLSALANDVNEPVFKELTFKLFSATPPNTPSEFVNWLGDFSKSLIDTAFYEPEIVIPHLTKIIQSLPIPQDGSIWHKLSPDEQIAAQDAIERISSMLSKIAFTSNTRFSTALQNSGAQLAIIGYELATLNEPKGVLSAFRFDFSSYIQLAKSPYFYLNSYADWQKRTELLQAIKIQKKELFGFNLNNDIKRLLEAILEAYPSIAKDIDQQLAVYYESQHTSFDLTPADLLGKVLLKLTSQRISNFETPPLKSISLALRTLMHVEMLHSPNAYAQNGTLNTLSKEGKWAFDLIYAKKLDYPIEFQNAALGDQLPLLEEATSKNLIPEKRYLDSQNQTLDRLLKVDEKTAADAVPFEETAVAPGMTAVNLLGRLKSHLSLLKDPKKCRLLEQYLFKVIIDKHGNESWPLLNELNEHPVLFTTLLKELLEALSLQYDSSQELQEVVNSLVLRLYALANRASISPLQNYLESWIENEENKLQSIKTTTDTSLQPRRSMTSLMFRLKAQETKLPIDPLMISFENWQQYLTLGQKVQEIWEQKGSNKESGEKAEQYLTASEVLWWRNYTYEMTLRFQTVLRQSPESAYSILKAIFMQKDELILTDFPLCKTNDDAVFNFLTLTFLEGKAHPIPFELKEHPEFKRVFPTNLPTLRVKMNNKDFVCNLIDQNGIRYRFSSTKKFPDGFQRKIGKNWCSYIPSNSYLENLGTKDLQLPSTIAHELIFWINGVPNGGVEDTSIYGYDRCEPNRLILKSGHNNLLIFQEGPQKGMGLERPENHSSDFEEKTGAFGMYYYTFKPQLTSLGLDTVFQDRLIFPNIKTLNGKPLTFERINKGYYAKFIEVGNPHRQVKGTLFETSFRSGESYYGKMNPTPVKIHGLVIRTKESWIDFSDEGVKQSVLFPFQRHLSEPNSRLVQVHKEAISPETSSLLQSVETIEIKFKKNTGFLPTNASEALFAAYLLLLGKDYEGAQHLLKSVRPHQRLEKKERQILKWLIDSSNDAQDHSASAAAIKLKAYKLLVLQGIPLKDEVNPNELPSTSLEDIYRAYLRGRSSIPHPLKLKVELELWMIEKGFKQFPPQETSHSFWEKRNTELKKNESIIKLKPVKQRSPKPLLEIWSEGPKEPALPLTTIENSLIQGIVAPIKQPLIPGKPYPLEQFGAHYLALSSNKLSSDMAWPLIYEIETSIIPPFIKNCLQLAFIFKNEAPPLPKLHKIPSYSREKVIRQWFEKLPLPKVELDEEAPATIIIKPTKEDSLLATLSEETLASEKKLNLTVKTMVEERAKYNPVDLLCRAAEYAEIEADKNLPPLAGELFSEEDMAENLAKAKDLTPHDLKSYNREWQEGVKALSEQVRYPLLTDEDLKKLNDLFASTNLGMSAGDFEIEIRRHLNRYPLTTEEGLINATLAEASKNKSHLQVDEALQMLLYPNNLEKLRFLQKKNPYLTIEDIEILNALTTDYLNFLVSREKYKNIFEKLASFRKLSKTGDPKMEETWQEIGELIYQYSEHLLDENDPKKREEALLFEHLSGFRMRKEQIDILHNVLQKIFSDDPQELNPSIVFQLIMGGGKTSVILANIAKVASTKDFVPIFLTHHSQYASLKTNITQKQYERFGQDVIDLNFSREELSSLKVLKFIYEQLLTAKDKQRVLLMQTNFLQMLQLEFIANLSAWKDPQNLDPDAAERSKILAKTLQFIKGNALLIMDEIDLNANILQSLHFPSGGSVPLKKNHVDLIRQIYALLSTDSKLSSLLKLQSDDQSLAVSKMQTEVLPALVDGVLESIPQLTELIPLENPETFKYGLKRYLLGQIDGRLSLGISSSDSATFLDSLGFDNEQRKLAVLDLEFLKQLNALKLQSVVKPNIDALSLTKELVQKILPITLSKSFNKNYGFSKGSDIWKLINYLGVDAPATTECGNIYEMACYFFQAGLAQGVTQELLVVYRSKMQEAARYYAELYNCDISETSEAKHFEALTSLPLEGQWTKRDLDETISTMNQNPESCLDFYSEFANLSLQYHGSLLECSPVAVPYMGAKFIGCSGTLWNKQTFERSVAESCLSQEGTEGQIMVKLAADIVWQTSHFLTIKAATPKQILDAAFNKKFIPAGWSKEFTALNPQQNMRAIIDTGGLLKRFTNSEIAEAVMNDDRLKDSIQATLFLLKEGEDERFVLIKRGEAKPIELKSTSKEEIESHGVDIDGLFVYFDDLRTTGTDVPLKFDAFAVMSFDPNSTTMRSSLQGAARERGIFKNQTINLCILEDSLEGMCGYDKNDPEACLNVSNFLLTNARNEKRALKPQLERSAFEQIKECYRSYIAAKLVDEFSKEDVDEIQGLKKFAAAEWLFYSVFSDEPTELFFNIEREALGWQVIEEHLNSIHQRFNEQCSDLFPKEELEQIKHKADAVLEWAKKTLEWEIKTNTGAPSLQTQVSIENRVSAQISHDVNLNKDLQKEIQKYQVQIDAPAAKPIRWKKLTDRPTCFSDYEPPHFLSFRSLLQRTQYDAAYHEAFPDDLVLTENFSRTHEIDLPVFHRAQKKAQHLLIIKENEQFHTLFIDIEEADFWRLEILNNPIQNVWLSDLDGHSQHDKRQLPDDAEEIINRALWWGHFFNGNVNYLRAYPQLVKDEMKAENSSIKSHYLAVKTVSDPIQHKILNQDPLLNEETALPPPEVFSFSSKTDVIQWQDQALLNIDASKLNALPFYAAKYFTKAHVPLINKPNFFNYLPRHLFEYITAAQVNLVPNHKLRFLNKKEQVEALDKTKIAYLRGDAVQYLTGNDIFSIHFEEMANLTPENCKIYQEKTIEKIGVKKFARRITTQTAKAVLPACVPYIASTTLPYLSTQAQLKEVDPKKYFLLTPKQFHLLPSDNLHLLTLEQIQKYNSEKTLPDEVGVVIEKMNPEWANSVDKRLAKFFTPDQVKKINSPVPIPSLNIPQLQYLEGAFGNFLEPHHYKKLTSLTHAHLIKEIKEDPSIALLSDNALTALQDSQIASIQNRDTLVRLPERFYPLLSFEQILLLAPHHSADQKVIQKLTHSQVEKIVDRDILVHLDEAIYPHLSPEQILELDPNELSDQKIIQKLTASQIDTIYKSKKSLPAAFIPHLERKALRHVEMGTIEKSEMISPDVQKNLTSHQLQRYLREQKAKGADITAKLLHIEAKQWKKMDDIFVHTFFENEPKEIVQKIPKEKVYLLPDKTTLLWAGRDTKTKKRADALIGLFSLLLFPGTFILAISKRAISKRNSGVEFQKVIRWPMRLIDPAYYYRWLAKHT